MAKRTHKNSRHKTQPLAHWQAYLEHHVEVATFSLHKLINTPIASLMTIAVIGIALALPGTLYFLLSNAQAVSKSWDDSAQISLYLTASIEEPQARAISIALSKRPEIIDSKYISRTQALEEFRQYSGFGSVLDTLESNPLPGVIVAKPALAGMTSFQLQKLVKELQSMPSVELAQFDLEWVQRLYAIFDVIRYVVSIVTILLCLAVLLVIGNTIRLDILNRREEIEIIKLIGASDAFVRRPFLYGGFWYGLLGGIVATLLISIALVLLQEPINTLVKLYGSQFELKMMSLKMFSLLIGSSSFLGLVGAWLAVGRHLRHIKPS